MRADASFVYRMTNRSQLRATLPAIRIPQLRDALESVHHALDSHNRFLQEKSEIPDEPHRSDPRVFTFNNCMRSTHRVLDLFHPTARYPELRLEEIVVKGMWKPASDVVNDLIGQHHAAAIDLGNIRVLIDLTTAQLSGLETHEFNIFMGSMDPVTKTYLELLQRIMDQPDGKCVIASESIIWR